MRSDASTNLIRFAVFFTNYITCERLFYEIHDLPVEESHQPWIHSGKFQGDINVNPELLKQPNGDVFFNAMKHRDSLWLGGVIPYSLDPAYSFHERRIIRKAFSSFHSKTCIRFRRKKSSDVDFLDIVKGKGCYSQIGRTGGRQELSLGPGCLFHETSIHELMHSVGFWHEHSRSDREDFVKINWDNIIPGAKSQFDKIPTFIQDLLGEPYDYFSIMHYEATAFATNARYSIESLEEKFTDLMGIGSDLSTGDVVKINKLYNCPSNPGRDVTASLRTKNIETTTTNMEMTQGTTTTVSDNIDTAQEDSKIFSYLEYRNTDTDDLQSFLQID